MEIREAIVLAGGLGTRLKEVTGELPKVMAPVGDKPFLEYLFDYLIVNKITSAIVATGYGSSSVSDRFGNSYRGLSLTWSEETEPLGTGGAVRLALNHSKGEMVFVLNGDTLFNVPLQQMAEEAAKAEKPVTIAVKPMHNFDRYGTVAVKDGIVTGFREKQWCEEGLINGGTYILSPIWLSTVAPREKFSLEKDILEQYANKGLIRAWQSDAYFIDIGIPADYERARQEIPGLFRY
jgi:D-glycero-alpha-D-manno-heptose 1-phosphate guanylyltransferase